LPSVLAALDRALSQAPQNAALDDAMSYRQQRAVELLKRQVSRLQLRATELIEANEVRGPATSWRKGSTSSCSCSSGPRATCRSICSWGISAKRRHRSRTRPAIGRKRIPLEGKHRSVWEAYRSAAW